ncbi:CBO0543 family protein [Sporomusa aerivorans]|uniref:CBO0543 family protein n=1 Tax=Sporomusa aerivorans TaxID=204936 RepID=UPI00352B2410
MDTDYLIYQLRVELWQLLLADWKADTLTVKYWAMVGVIAFAYTMWYRLTDKRRLVDLLLYGSLIAVMRELLDLFGVSAGLWIYKVRILPLSPSVLLMDWTIIPLIYMLVQQHSPNWRQFFAWSAVGTTIIAGVIFPVLSALDILQLMRWNYFYGFVSMFVVATLSRAAFHLVVQVQSAAREGKPAPLENTLLQPALKPLDKQGGEEDK